MPAEVGIQVFQDFTGPGACPGPRSGVRPGDDRDAGHPFVAPHEVTWKILMHRLRQADRRGFRNRVGLSG